MPSEELLAAMGKFNEELVNAGVMLDGEGLHPSSKAKRVKFQGGNRIVTDGPFAETRELIAGFWIWRVKSLDEAVDWVKRMPDCGGGGEVEIPQIFALNETCVSSSWVTWSTRCMNSGHVSNCVHWL